MVRYRKRQAWLGFYLSDETIYDLDSWPEWLRHFHPKRIRRADAVDGKACIEIDRPPSGTLMAYVGDWIITEERREDEPGTDSDVEFRVYRHDVFDEMFVAVVDQEEHERHVQNFLAGP